MHSQSDARPKVALQPQSITHLSHQYQIVAHVDKATCVDKEPVFRRRMERLYHLSYNRTCDAVILDQALFR